MNITPINTTIMYDKNNLSLYNTGCIDEITKFQSRCTDFQADILSSVNHNFKLFLIALIVFVLIKFYFDNFVNSEWKYYNLISGRLSLITFLLALCTSAFFFM